MGTRPAIFKWRQTDPASVGKLTIGRSDWRSAGTWLKRRQCHRETSIACRKRNPCPCHFAGARGRTHLLRLWREAEANLPGTEQVFEEMRQEEIWHRRRLIQLYQQKSASTSLSIMSPQDALLMPPLHYQRRRETRFFRGTLYSFP